MKANPSLAAKPCQRALVLGATGHVGNAVVRALLARGVSVTAATRRPQPTPNLAGLDVTLSPGNADEPRQLDKWVESHDLVVDAAAPYPLRQFHPEQPSEVAPLRYAQERTERLIAAVRRQGAKLAVVSSFTTLPHPGVLNGELEPKLVYRSHPYFAVKDTIDGLLLAEAKRGLPVVLVNPTAFLGPWDFKDPSLCLIPLAINGKLPMTAARVINVIDVRDVADALIRALVSERFGERIGLSGHNVPISQLIEQACALAGTRPPLLAGSTRVGAAVAYWAEAAFGAVGMRSPLPAALPLLLMRYSYPTSPSAAQRELGVEIRPLRESLRDAIDWYASIKYFAALDFPVNRRGT